MSMTPLTFAAFDLQDDNFVTGEIGDTVAPERPFEVHEIDREHGGAVTNDFYRTKVIPVSGKIVDDTVAALEGKIDSFHKAMTTKNGDLDIGYGGGTRRYVATPQRVSVTRPVRAAAWANFEVEFLVTGFGKDTSETTLLASTNITVVPHTESFTVDGSAPAQMPVITVQINTVSGATDSRLSIHDEQNGGVIDITRDWADGDTLVIDRTDRSVKVNNTTVSYSGRVFEYGPGSAGIKYDDAFDSRDVDLSVTYTKRYI